MSYDTALDATHVARFPDWINKVVLKDVVNPNKYYKGLYVITTYASLG